MTMSLRDFLTRVLPDEGPYITVTTGSRNQLNAHNHTESIDEVVGWLNIYSGKRKPAYFAVGSFSDKKRTGKTALKKRCLYADIDCAGANPQYPNKKAAMTAVKAFVQATKLKPSLIVDSGNGYHLYWEFDQDIDVSLWQGYAKSLDAEFTNHGLLTDSKITTDAARVLRAPGTVNFKDPLNPKKCDVILDTQRQYTTDEMATLLHMDDPDSGTAIQPPSRDLSAFSDNDDLSGGMEGRPKKAAEMVTRCHAFTDAMLTGGAQHPGTLWHKLLHTLAYCEDGRDYIHEVSKGHPDYDPDETEERFDYSCNLRDGDKSMGATTCAKIEEAAPSLCQQCQYKGQIKSPIALSMKVTQRSEAQAQEFPFPYYQNRDGIWRGNPDDAPPTLVTTTRIADIQLCDDIQEGTVLMFNNISLDPPKPVRLTGAAIMSSSGDAANKSLTDGGVWLRKHQRPMFLDMITSWAQQLQLAGVVRKSSRSFGWVNDGVRDGFSYGEAIWWDDGAVTPSPRADVKLTNQYSPSGDFATWQRVAQTVLDPARPEAQIAVASAFGAPLLKFTGHSGAILSFVSPESGTGKTTALKVAQSVWGCPQRGLNSLNDTPLSVTKKLGILQNLPAYWDEIRVRDDPDGFVKMIFQVAQGKEKSRLTAGTAMQDMGTWHTLIGCASNEALKDHIDNVVKGSDAGIMRILEMQMPVLNLQAGTIAASMQQYGSLAKHFGLAGERYAAWLATHTTRIEQDVNTLMTAIGAKLHIRSEERFWLATITSIILGAKYATELGILQFDTKVIMARLLKAVADQRGAGYDPAPTPEKKAQSKTDLLADLITRYRTQYAQNATIVKDMTPIGTKSMGKQMELVAPAQRAPLMYQYDATHKIVRLPRNEFKNWLYGQGFTTAMLDHLESLSCTTMGRGRLQISASEQIRPRVYDVLLGGTSPLSDGEDDDLAESENDDLTS